MGVGRAFEWSELTWPFLYAYMVVVVGSRAAMVCDLVKGKDGLS